MENRPRHLHVLASWPTPKSAVIQDNRGSGEIVGNRLWRNGQDYSLDLATAVNWPTPQTRDYRSPDNPTGIRALRKRREGWTPNLNDVASWSTPTTNDATGTHGGGMTRSLRTDTHGMGGQLNPAFVEMLMGLPPGWTEVDEE